MASSNPFVLAADNPSALLSLLRESPSIATVQDEHGYSLLHAAASYDQVDLVRQLVDEFHVNVNIRDEDGETPLFQVESVEVARLLTEELGADQGIKNADGITAAESIENDAEWPLVAAFLRQSAGSSISAGNGPLQPGVLAELQGSSASSRTLPRLPAGVSINIGTMNAPAQDLDADDNAAADVVDPELRRRIEELASHGNFAGDEGQRQLRDLITEAVRGHVVNGADEREVRRRVD